MSSGARGPQGDGPQPSAGQVAPERQRVHLLLSAGGVRCLSYIGAIAQLEDQGYEFATVSTCSAGTFVGALYCSGLSSAELREAALGLDLRRLTGGGRWLSLRRLRTLRSWPFALHAESGFGAAFTQLLEEHGVPSSPTLGQLHPPLSTAAVDVAAQRMLVYSTQANPDMPVADLLRIAVALPLVYPPHERQGREVLDAAVATHSPVWLATGQEEDLPIVVLRAPAPTDRRPRRNVVAWTSQVMSSSVASRDTILLERLPRVRVCDIETGVPDLADLSRGEVERVIDSGRRAVAECEERRAEPALMRLRAPDQEQRAEREAEGLYGRHLDHLLRQRTPTVFLSYAEEDREWVVRLRSHLGELLADLGVSVWDDRYIPPGARWSEAIESAVRHARVAVLLVSSHFRASDYITRTEVPLLREQAARRPLPVLWVSVDGSLPEEPERALQGIGSPERPLAGLDEAAADRVLAQLARVVTDEYRRTAASG